MKTIKSFLIPSLLAVFIFNGSNLNADNSNTIPRSQFFKHVTGFSELDFKKYFTPGYSIITPKDFLKGPYCNGNYRISGLTAAYAIDVNQGHIYKFEPPCEYQAGKFTTLSIADLRTKSDEKLKTMQERTQGRFSIVDGSMLDKGSDLFRHVDIGALQADPQNKDAVFQVASNFNALEAGGDPNDGIEQYLHTTAQGEEAAISAAPGTIYRMYFLPHLVNGKLYVGQLEKQINFLEEFDGQRAFKIPVQNGYINFSDKTKCPALSNKDIEKYLPLIKIGYHSDTQVTTGFSMLKPNDKWSNEAWNKCGLHQKSTLGLSELATTDKPQLINQVFTAAVNLANPENSWQPNIDDLARMLLFAAYEGTLRAAFVNGKTKVFLTLVGGGVFLNKVEWIAEAIERMTPFITKSGLDVTLIIYRNIGNDIVKDRFWHMTSEMSGKYTTLGVGEGRSIR